MTQQANVNSPISLEQLTPDQITALKNLMKTERKSQSGKRKSWNEIVDAMLQEKDDTGFMHTTSDILDSLQAKNVVPTTLDRSDREAMIKKIQTRKQLLSKKRDDKGNLQYQVGYKPSGGGFAITLDRVILWCKTASTSDLASLAKAIKPLTK